MISWHRFYDPETGRYVSADPIGLDGGINLYAYVQNNPVKRIDPMGFINVPGLGNYTPSQIQGMAEAQSQQNVLNNFSWGSVNGTIGLGGYFGGGAEASMTRTTYCDNGAKYRVTFVTICGGAGIGAGMGAETINDVVSPSVSTGGISSSNGIPRTHYYFKHDVSVGPLAPSVEVPLDSHPNASINIQYPSLGTNWAFCSDTIISIEKIGCCSE